MTREKTNWKRKIKNLPIDRKFFFAFLFPLILMLVISLAAIQVSLNLYDHAFSRATVKELGYFIDKVDGSFAALESFSYRLAMNYDTQRLLYQNFQIRDYSKYQYEMRSVMLRFLQEAMSSESVESFVYTDGSRLRYANGRSVSEIPDDAYRDLVAAAHEGKGKLVFSGPTKDYPYLLSARDIRYYINADLTYLGTLVFVTDFSKIIAPFEPILGIGQNYLFIEDGRTLVYSNAPGLSAAVQAIADPLPDRGYAIRKVNGKRFFICAARSSRTGWRFVDMFPYGELFATSLRTRLSLIAGFVTLYVMAFFSVRGISRRITGPVKDLSDSMAIVGEGKFDEALRSLGSDFPTDEIGRLRYDYAIMLKTIRSLIKENYESRLILKDTEYRALKAQINPHFLYNTLNSIGWMVQLKRSDEARQMITSLGNLLHRSIRPEIMTTVEDEVELLRDYLYIQKIRYEERAEFALGVEAKLGKARMPQMLLQPLVENCVYHAVDESLSPCHVSIEISRDDSRLGFTVRDDGPGMDDATLDAVRSFREGSEAGGIGLKNIHARLSLIYGDDFSFSIQSAKGRGTSVAISIPLAEGGE